MSAEQPRTLTDGDADAIAKALLANASDPEQAKKLADVLEGYVDRVIGRGFRRLLWLALIFLLGMGVSNKEGFLDFIVRLFSHK